MSNQNESQGSGGHELSRGVVETLSNQFARENSGTVLGTIMESFNMQGEVVDLEVLTITGLELGFKKGFETALNWVNEKESQARKG